jgi:hypothetical protein
MSGVAGRSGRKTFVPTPEQRNTVRSLVGPGIPQKQICRLVVNRQTQKPLDHKTLRKHFAHEIAIGTAELHALIGKFMLATIFGTPPPAGTVAIDDQRARGSLLRFFAETRMAGQRRVADCPKEHVRGPIEDQDGEKMRQKLSDKIDRVRQCLNAGRTGESSEGCAREDHQFAQPRTRHRRMA